MLMIVETGRGQEAAALVVSGLADTLSALAGTICYMNMHGTVLYRVLLRLLAAWNLAACRAWMRLLTRLRAPLLWRKGTYKSTCRWAAVMGQPIGQPA